MVTKKHQNCYGQVKVPEKITLYISCHFNRFSYERLRFVKVLFINKITSFWLYLVTDLSKLEEFFGGDFIGFSAKFRFAQLAVQHSNSLLKSARVLKSMMILVENCGNVYKCFQRYTCMIMFMVKFWASLMLMNNKCWQLNGRSTGNTQVNKVRPN